MISSSVGGVGGTKSITGIFEGTQNITLQLANGEVIARAVKPYLLKGYNAIVS